MESGNNNDNNRVCSVLFEDRTEQMEQNSYRNTKPNTTFT